MNKKIIVLNGSPKRERSTTMRATRAFVSGIAAATGAEIEYINISDLNIKPCRGCLSCWAKTEGRCVITGDDIAEVKAKIEAADFVVESFPLYFFGMPGTVKLFTDRMLSMLNTYEGQRADCEAKTSLHGIRNPKPNRKFVVISGCAYSDSEGVFDALKKQLNYICGSDNYLGIFCPQLMTLVDVGDSPRLDRYLKKFEAAGRQFGETGALDDKTKASLSAPPFFKDTYKILLDGFWDSQRQEGNK